MFFSTDPGVIICFVYIKQIIGETHKACYHVIPPTMLHDLLVKICSFNINNLKKAEGHRDHLLVNMLCHFHSIYTTLQIWKDRAASCILASIDILKQWGLIRGTHKL